jgi:hypothetical protein
MSDLPSLFKDGGNLPTYLKQQEVDAVTKALTGGGGNTKRISVKGGVFRMMAGGEEVAQNDDRAMNIIIVNAAPKVSRTYYAGTYVEGQEAKPPECWSADGEKPDATIKAPQAKLCSQCPQNVAGSGQGESRACRYSQRLAVVLEGDMHGDVFQLSLASTSIFGKGEPNKLPLQAYARNLAAHGVPVSAVVTEMRFDTSVSTPKLTFRAIRPLAEDEYEAVQTIGQSYDAVQAITMTVSQRDNVKPKEAEAEAEAEPEQEAPAPAVEAKKAAKKVEKAVEDEPKKVDNGKGPVKDIGATLAAWDDDE